MTLEHQSGSAVIQKLVAYQTKHWAVGLFAAVAVATGGLAWVLGRLFPCLVTWTMRLCPTEKADFVLVKMINGDEKLCKVHDVHLAHTKLKDVELDSESDHARVFVLLLQMYMYIPAAGTFRPVPPMPAGLSLQVFNAKKALALIAEGAEWSILNPVSSWPRQARATLYGSSDMTAGKPSLVAMSGQLLAYPLYLIQYVQLAFTLYERYWIYAGALLAITLVSGFVSTYELYRKKLQLFQAVAQRRIVPIVQAGRVRAVSSHRLVPGDIVVLLRGKATCDMVLLHGCCLAEESMLSGEAAQVRKTCFAPPEDGDKAAGSMYSPETHHFCTIHAGTYVQQVWNEHGADEECLAMVVQIGLSTTMGSMLRQVIAPVNAVNYYRDPFIMDVLHFCSFALVFQLAIFMLYASRADRHPHDAKGVMRHVIDMLIAAVPVPISTVLIFSLFRCVVRLKRQHIEVLQTTKIKAAAAVEVVVFDKTGTLTGSLQELHGMLPVSKGSFQVLQQDAVHWPNSLKQCAAVCNTLNFVSKSRLVGDVADFEAFKSCEARFSGRNTVTLPLRRGRQRSAHMSTLTILRRFEFQPHLLRSGVIAVESAGSADDMLLFIRGAPSSIEQVIGRGKAPDTYHEVIDEFSGQSFRLLALAKGVVKGLDRQALAMMTQEQLEQQAEFELVGLLVLSNHLRPDSKETITQLQQHAGLRTLMSTGDYHHTALAVARGVGMVPPQGQVIIIQTELETRSSAPSSRSPAAKASEKPPHRLARHLSRSVSFAEHLVVSREREHQGLIFHVDNGNAAHDDALQALAAIAQLGVQGEAQCCVTGAAFQHMIQLGNESLLVLVMSNAVVFSRMKPYQKGQVMDLLGHRGLHKDREGQQQHLNGLGKTCMYCGDGINDLIALAAADVGVAIGASDASAAAGISTKECSIAGLVSILRESRAAQTVKVAAIKYMVLYQLLLALMINSAFYMDGSHFNYKQRGILDFSAISLGMVCSLRPAVARLTSSHPQQSLCKLKNLVSLGATVFLSACMYWGCIGYMTEQNWYVGGNGSDWKNPVITCCWTCCLCQVNCTPALIFYVDTHEFCALSSWPEAILTILYMIFAGVCCLTGLAVFDKLDFFGFYEYPWGFRWRVDLIGWAFVLLFAVVLAPLHVILYYYEHKRRVTQVLPTLASTRPQP